MKSKLYRKKHSDDFCAANPQSQGVSAFLGEERIQSPLIDRKFVTHKPTADATLRTGTHFLEKGEDNLWVEEGCRAPWRHTVDGKDILGDAVEKALLRPHILPTTFLNVRNGLAVF